LVDDAKAGHAQTRVDTENSHGAVTRLATFNA
jgi:hypothetical protein